MIDALDTPRLRLEPLSLAHADALFAIYSEPGVRRFLITRPRHRTDFDHLFERMIRFAASHGMWALLHPSSPYAIGRAGFFAFGASARPELAFLLSQAFWGQGLATEASAACLQYGFEQRRWSNVIALVRPRNRAAIRVLTKLRMRAQQEVELGGEAAMIYEVSRARFQAHDADNQGDTPRGVVRRTE